MRVPFDRRSTVVAVSAMILGPSKEIRANLILDTGATWSLLGTRILREAGYDRSIAEEQRTITSATGSTRVPAIRVQRFRVLGKERLSFPVLWHDLPAALRVDGLLGLDFLRLYRLNLDFPGGHISLRP